MTQVWKVDVMRRIVTSAVAVIITFSMFAADQAEAGRRNRHRSGPARMFQQSNGGGGFLRNLMELERRKNAWLRATFFGG